MDKDGLFEPLEAKYKGIVEEYYEMVMSAEGEVATSRRPDSSHQLRRIATYLERPPANAFGCHRAAAHQTAMCKLTAC